MDIPLPTHDKVLFPDNELLLMKFDNVSDWNNAVVISTGEADKYKVQRSRRRGILANQTLTYFEVVHLVLELHAMGAKLGYNYLFPGGIKQCIELGVKEFNFRAETEECYALAKKRIHEDWESLTIIDASGNQQAVVKNEKKPSGGITGVAHPTGKEYCCRMA